MELGERMTLLHLKPDFCPAQCITTDVFYVSFVLMTLSCPLLMEELYISFKCSNTSTFER